MLLLILNRNYQTHLNIIFFLFMKKIFKKVFILQQIQILNAPVNFCITHII